MSSNEGVLPLLERYYSLEAIARDPWNENSELYVPLESQHIVHGATALASFLLLKILKLPFSLKFAKNVCEMSPSGKSPLLRCGKYIIGEYESIVNFCNLKNIYIQKHLSNDVKSQIKVYLILIEKKFSEIISFILYKETSSRQALNNMYNALYPWPLNKFIYYSDYFFIRNKLKINEAWNVDKDKMINRFIETIDAINRKLKDSSFLVENILTEADLLLYSYLKIIKNYNEFNELNLKIENFIYIVRFYNVMNNSFAHLINQEYFTTKKYDQ